MQLLRDDTAKVWGFLKEHPALSEALLVGGTALTLHVGHRLSEDLDFVFMDKWLPRRRIDALKRSGIEHHHPFASNDSAEAIEEFEFSGMDLLNYQQNYLVSGTVKVTFFCPDPEVLVHLSPGMRSGPRVATLDEIFAMKCLVAADRSKTRDWFDLYTLMHDHGYTASQFEAVFAKSKVPQKMDIALNRLCSARPHLMDEGYSSLLSNAQTLEQMSTFFTTVADDARTAAARRRMAQIIGSAPRISRLE